MPKKLVKKKSSHHKKAKKAKKAKSASTKLKRKVLAVPKGYHSITPYLIVRNASKAIDFYKTAFGAKEKLRMEMPPGTIKHAELVIGDALIMLADEFREMGAKSPEAYGGSPVGIHLYVKNVDEVVEDAVSAGASLIRPIENMFYGDRMAKLTDPFGHIWSVSTHVEDVSNSTIRKRAQELFREHAETA